MAKIKMKTAETLAESIERFLLSKSAKGISEKTMQTYSQHFHAIGKHLDLNQETEKLSSAALGGMSELVSERTCTLQSKSKNPGRIFPCKPSRGFSPPDRYPYRGAHNLTRVLRRGLEAAEDHCLLSATALNLKRMIRCQG